jgi:hypothetical protein
MGRFDCLLLFSKSIQVYGRPQRFVEARIEVSLVLEFHLLVVGHPSLMIMVIIINNVYKSPFHMFNIFSVKNLDYFAYIPASFFIPR